MVGGFIKREVCAVMLVVFGLTSVIPSTYAQTALSLPPPGQMVALSPGFNPPVLKGIKVYPDNPLRFDFILDKGDDKSTDEQIKTDSTRLIKYFLASLTIPEKDLWVNLSPYEKDRIVPEDFGQTEMGRDLLAQDYLLKQITSSLLYPEGDTGKKFWNKIYALAKEKFGTTDIPVDTFNKVWIVPEKAVVYENGRVGAAYVTESRLKVMLETDYLATSNNVLPTGGHDALLGTVSPSPLKATQGDSQPLTVTENDIAKSVLREIVIPVLEKEVNEGKSFAQLRQVYQSLILATWYKKMIKQSLLSAVYVDRNKTDGVNIADPKEAEKIWGQYVEAFKKGAYNFVKEEKNLSTGEVIPRKYFSGGVAIAAQGDLQIHHDAAQVYVTGGNAFYKMPVELIEAAMPEDNEGDGFMLMEQDPLEVDIIHLLRSDILAADQRIVAILSGEGTFLLANEAIVTEMRTAHIPQTWATLRQQANGDDPFLKDSALRLLNLIKNQEAKDIIIGVATSPVRLEQKTEAILMSLAWPEGVDILTQAVTATPTSVETDLKALIIQKLFMSWAYDDTLKPNIEKVLGELAERSQVIINLQSCLNSKIYIFTGLFLAALWKSYPALIHDSLTLMFDREDRLWGASDVPTTEHDDRRIIDGLSGHYAVQVSDIMTKIALQKNTGFLTRKEALDRIERMSNVKMIPLLEKIAADQENEPGIRLDAINRLSRFSVANVDWVRILEEIAIDSKNDLSVRLDAINRLSLIPEAVEILSSIIRSRSDVWEFARAAFFKLPFNADNVDLLITTAEELYAVSAHTEETDQDVFDLFGRIYEQGLIENRGHPVFDRYCDIQQVGLFAMREFFDDDRYALPVDQLRAEAHRVRSGGMDLYNELHVILNYSNLRQSVKGMAGVDIGYEQFYQMIERIRGQGKSADELIQISEPDQIEIRGLVSESYLVWKQILAEQERAAREGRPVVVVANLSYGAVALMPVITVGGDGREYIFGTTIPVIKTKIASSESYVDESVLKPNLFTDQQIREFMEQRPNIVVVDGTTSVATLEPALEHIPHAFRGYRNYFMAYDEVVFGDVRPGWFYTNNAFQQRLRSDSRYLQLIERLQSVWKKLGANQKHKYMFRFWYPGDKSLSISFAGDDLIAPNMRTIGDDFDGPRVLFIQSAREIEAMTAEDRDYVNSKKFGRYTPAFFDDKAHFCRFSLRYEEGYGFIPSKVYSDFARGEFQRFLKLKGEQLSTKEIPDLNLGIVLSSEAHPDPGQASELDHLLENQFSVKVGEHVFCVPSLILRAENLFHASLRQRKNDVKKVNEDIRDGKGVFASIQDPFAMEGGRAVLMRYDQEKVGVLIKIIQLLVSRFHDSYTSKWNRNLIRLMEFSPDSVRAELETMGMVRDRVYLNMMTYVPKTMDSQTGEYRDSSGNSAEALLIAKTTIAHEMMHIALLDLRRPQKLSKAMKMVYSRFRGVDSFDIFYQFLMNQYKRYYSVNKQSRFDEFWSQLYFSSILIIFRHNVVIRNMFDLLRKQIMEYLSAAGEKETVALIEGSHLFVLREVDQVLKEIQRLGIHKEFYKSSETHDDASQISSSRNIQINRLQRNSPGGIDFNSSKLNLQTQNAGGGLDFHIDPSMLQQMQNATGFFPVIIGIQPINSLGSFLGLNPA